MLRAEQVRGIVRAMRNRKNTLLLFSKPPIAGLVKTRLTKLKDGIFEPEVASGLYHCMLFDVVEICCAALATMEQRAQEYERESCARGVAENMLVHDTYELLISTTPQKNVAVMEKLFADAGEWPRELVFIADAGKSFDEHYNDAFNQAWQRGADCVLSMGADMPALHTKDVIGGFEALHTLDNTERGGIVLSPDQAMGVSIVGWPRKTKFDHTGVFYNPTGLTVLPAYIEKARNAQLPALYLPAVPDVDTMGDLMHNVTLVEALNYCAAFENNTPPWRTAQALKEMGWDKIVVPPNDLRDPRDEIDV